MYVIHRAAPYTISTLNAVPPSLPSPSFQASPKHPALALKFPSYSLACPSIFRFFSNHHKQMADFSPNLDDGELYLPSDIYPEELSTHFGSPEVFPSELTYMEELAQQLSSLAVIDRPSPQPSPKPPFSPCFEIRPLLPPQPGFGAFPVADSSRHNLGVFGHGGFCVSPRPVHPLQPFPVQVEPFVHGRAVRLLQRQQNQGQDRFLPFRASGSGTAGSARGSCGTGVFLPRVFIADARRKPGSRKVEEKKPMSHMGLGSKGIAFQHPQEKALPQDWTY